MIDEKKRKQILELVKTKPMLSINDLRKSLGWALATAQRYLLEMEIMGDLERIEHQTDIDNRQQAENKNRYSVKRKTIGINLSFMIHSLYPLFFNFFDNFSPAPFADTIDDLFISQADFAVCAKVDRYFCFVS